jgi:hypothetical protein
VVYLMGVAVELSRNCIIVSLDNLIEIVGLHEKHIYGQGPLPREESTTPDRK